MMFMFLVIRTEIADKNRYLVKIKNTEMSEVQRREFGLDRFLCFWRRR